MNKKGFTLVELLATLVVLGIVVGLAITGISINIKKTKKKAEEAYISTLRDAIKVYLDDDISLNKIKDWDKAGSISKASGNFSVYSTTITLGDIIDSTYRPITEDDLKNPASGKTCSKDTIVTIYKDDDQVYYYSINRDDLRDCLLEEDGEVEQDITNLPRLNSE